MYIFCSLQYYNGQKQTSLLILIYISSIVDRWRIVNGNTRLYFHPGHGAERMPTTKNLWYNSSMNNILRNTTQLAMSFISQYLYPGCTVVDATCGNGKDTIALARSAAGWVYGFDIQKTAIERTKKALEEEGLYSDRIRLIRDGHENMGAYIRGSVQVVVFNLGYLPATSKEITTQAKTTVQAVKEALRLLETGGLICITMYSGHAGGEEEKQQLLLLAKDLDPRAYHVAYVNMLNQRNHPPEILLITSKRGVEFEKDKNRMHAGTGQLK